MSTEIYTLFFFTIHSFTASTTAMLLFGFLSLMNCLLLALTLIANLSRSLHPYTWVIIVHVPSSCFPSLSVSLSKLSELRSPDPYTSCTISVILSQRASRAWMILS